MRIDKWGDVTFFRGLIEEGEELVKLFLRDRIKICGVVAAARRPVVEAHRTLLPTVVCTRSHDDELDAVFLVDDRAFAVHDVVAVEGGGDFLI